MTQEKRLIFITGAAGFIGYHLSKALLDQGETIVGYDNLNDYYEVSLKESRLKNLAPYDNFTFIKGDLGDKAALEDVFKTYGFDIVINLAAQSGVRDSIENPEAYINSNIIGFFNILECCRHYPVKHLIYASSSSVYGDNKKIPFSTEDPVDHPVSLYAATKKSNELLAYSYSKLYDIHATGLRFFTVYGPYGRPDMAYFCFTQNILAGQPIKVFNHGDMCRDFAYIDDIVEGIIRLIPHTPQADENNARYKVYNIGNNRQEKLLDFIGILEDLIGKEAQKSFSPMQLGDVYQTYADVTDLMADVGFKPETSLKDGLAQFWTWFKAYYA
ncbi:NAD-dependent epimerase/dehydratase family protein [Eubacterium aggregans]|uniref:NAD-dependent epimerase/dehydratase family protein n=1 Tax=Eubacterium aggregans TaxID=81409 RepID=UPI003F3E93FB